jgi:hypothetical protein
MAGQITLHPFDAELMFRTTGNLTQDESAGILQVWGGIRQGLAAQVIVPSANGANDTILPKIYRSADGSTYNLVSQYAGGAQVVPSGGLALIVPFPVLPGKNYIKLELDGTAASTTYNFGAVVAGIIPNPGHDYDRTNHWA